MRSINATGDSMVTRFANIGGFSSTVSSNSNSSLVTVIYLVDENNITLEDENGVPLDDE